MKENTIILAHRVKSFKNVPKTMAQCHQEMLCYRLSGGGKGSPFAKNTLTGPGNTFLVLLPAKLNALSFIDSILEVSSLRCKEQVLETFPSFTEESTTRYGWQI